MYIRLAIIVAFSSIALTALADDAQQVFDSIYGQRIKAAKASVSRDDDHALAKELVEAAGKSTDTPALLALMCEASYDLSNLHADGFATAAQAMSLLAESVESQRTSAREKLVDVLMKQSRLGKADEREVAGEALIDTLVLIGDEKMEAKKWNDAAGDYRRAQSIAASKKSPMLDTIKAKLDLASRRDRAEKQIARLSEKLLADANDSVTAEEIVMLYVVEFDDPKSALPFLNRIKDEQLKKLVPLAAKAVSDDAEGDCLELGEWYRGAAGKSGDETGRAMRLRSADYLARALASEKLTELQRKKAELLLKDVKSEIDRLPRAAMPKSVSSKSTSAFKPEEWEVRIWNGERWMPRPLSLIESAVKDRVATLKNTQAGHGTIHLCFAKPVDGNFSAEITAKGISFVGVGSGSGQDVNYNVRIANDTRDQWRTIRVNREGTKLVISIDGKEVRQDNPPTDHPTMKGYFFVGIDRSETAQIREFAIRTK